MRFLAVYGTRPEYLKIKPLLDINAQLEIKTLHVKQHNDIIDFGKPDLSIKVDKKCESRLNSIFSEIFLKTGDIFKDFDYVLVQGDTATVAACAISAFNLGKKIIYLESGLRSFDLENPFPEEGYRQMISRIASVHLCPTSVSLKNLNDEKIGGDKFVVGNTSLDNLTKIKEKASYLNKVLITLHRRENIPHLEEWFEHIQKTAEKYPDIEFFYPLHPNEEIKEKAKKLQSVTKTGPMPHKDLINLMKDCKLIITDSGGIQEEASFLNKKVIVCRKTTERPEGIESGHTTLCKDPASLIPIFDDLIFNFKIEKQCPYGDGSSASVIQSILSVLK